MVLSFQVFLFLYRCPPHITVQLFLNTLRLSVLWGCHSLNGNAAGVLCDCCSSDCSSAPFWLLYYQLCCRDLSAYRMHLVYGSLPHHVWTHLLFCSYSSVVWSGPVLFHVPTSLPSDHDFLSRGNLALPPAGQHFWIGILTPYCICLV